jgi:hypothetical protein
LGDSATTPRITTLNTRFLFYFIRPMLAAFSHMLLCAIWASCTLCRFEKNLEINGKTFTCSLIRTLNRRSCLPNPLVICIWGTLKNLLNYSYKSRELSPGSTAYSNWRHNINVLSLMIVSCLAANGAVLCSPKKSSTDCKAH